MRLKKVILGLAFMAVFGGCSAELDLAAEAEAPATAVVVESEAQSIKGGTPLGQTERLAVVGVSTRIGTTTRSLSCVGTLIAEDTVLTAAHCSCTDSECFDTSTVIFRSPIPGGVPTTIGGTVVRHPAYRHYEAQDDLAVIKLNSDAPFYVEPYRVRGTRLINTAVTVIGQGSTSSDCGPGEPLNRRLVTIDRRTDGDRIIQFDNNRFCPGDSGGPALIGDMVVGVTSGYAKTWTKGTVGKSVNVYRYHQWIRDQTCGSSMWSYCSDKGPICKCADGYGDCDDNADCRNVCVHNVGELFGYPASVDVCAANNSPPQGTCRCENDFGPVCTSITSRDNCAAGFTPSCTPRYNTSGACGGCECI